MATYMSNKGKGRFIELYNRVESNDPTNSAFVLVPLSAAGTEEQGQDIDDLKALLEDANFTEQTEGGWERVVLSDAELAELPEPNDEANRYDVENPEIELGEIESGKDIVGFAVCYDSNTTEGEDDAIEFLGHTDFAIEGDGSEVIVKKGDIFQGS